MRALGARYRSSALAQEKTGEAFVDGQLYGGHTRGEYEHAEVAVFVGKNPWQSQSFPRARVVLRQLSRDPGRCLIVIDPVRTETAELADIHLRVRPGTDAWCLAAMLGVIVQNGLFDDSYSPYSAWKCAGLWSPKYIRTTIPKNRVTSGISSLDSTLSARPAPGNLRRPHRPSAAVSPARLGPRLRCDCAVTSAVCGGVSDHRGIPTLLKTQPLRPNWTGLSCQPSGSIPVSATKFSPARASLPNPDVPGDS